MGLGNLASTGVQALGLFSLYVVCCYTDYTIPASVNMLPVTKFILPEISFILSSIYKNAISGSVSKVASLMAWVHCLSVSHFHCCFHSVSGMYTQSYPLSNGIISEATCLRLELRSGSVVPYQEHSSSNTYHSICM